LSEILLELSNTATVTLNERLNWVRVLDRISHFVLFVASEMLIITFKSLSEQLKIFKKKWFTKKNYLEYFF